MTDAGLSEAELTAAVVRPGGLWREIRVVAETGSTNTDLVVLAEAGAPEGTVLVAETQTAGRGRQGRTWVSPPGTALTFSALLRPSGVPVARRGWLPLLAGVAAARALRATTGLDVALKWPNDILLDGRKLGGILVELAGTGAGTAAVVGIGINVSTPPAALPPGATSLEGVGSGRRDRGEILGTLLHEMAGVYGGWRDAGGDADACGLRAAYREVCATLGTRVRVELPGGGALIGVATDVEADGRLTVTSADGPRTVSAGDIVHLRRE